MSFAWPYCFLLFLPLCVAAWRMLRRGRRSGVKFAPVSRLPLKTAGWRARLANMTPWLFLLGAALLVVACARPRKALNRESRNVDAIAIAMTVDVSGSMEALDLQLARILAVVDKLGGVAIITADHGNADEMAELDKKTKAPKTNADGSYKAKTSHTLNPVPCILYDASGEGKLSLKADDGSFGLSNVAATVVNLLGYEAPEMWDSSLIEIK